MYVRRTPGVLAGGLKQPAHRPLCRDRVRLGHHRLKLVAAILVDAEPPPEVVVRLPLVPDIVATIRARLPDIDYRVAYGGAVRGGNLAVDEEHVPVLHALVLFVNLHRLLAPGWVLSIEWSLHVFRCDNGVAFVGDGVHQYRGLGDVGKQDELLFLADLGQKVEHRQPLLFGYSVLPYHLVYRFECLWQDQHQPLATHLFRHISHRCYSSFPENIMSSNPQRCRSETPMASNGSLAAHRAITFLGCLFAEPCSELQRRTKRRGSLELTCCVLS